MSTAQRHPASLEEAIDILIESNKDQLDNLRREAKKNFSVYHFTTGMNIRNGWNLWFNEPGDKLAEWFTSHDINHGDDRSGVIMKAFAARLSDEEFDLEAYKASIKKHWLKYGPKEWNGIVPVPRSKADMYEGD